VTERKPTGVSWQSWTEKQIEEGRRAGLFEGLSGHGKPIDGLDGTRDDEWWIKAKLRREKIDYLPPTIAIRGERDAAVAAALDAPDECTVRRLVDQINDRIRYVNSHTVAGPPSTVWVVDVDSILDRWRATHQSRVDDVPEIEAGLETGEPGAGTHESGADPARRWRRWFGGRRRPAAR
jgi:hypothetical protein